ncbi:MAG: BlaI/MecI/CopY family transcriptional regulator [Planctomycetota bacterium]|jgi:BlaI family penicillinase repressor
MKMIPKISESEWQVMRVLWAENPSTANEVVKALSATAWKPKTIKTLLNRLVKKKVLGFERKGREYHYYPLVAEAACVRAESRSFLRRVYGGALKPMLAAFLEHEDLSPQDIRDLKGILDEKERAE